MKYIFCETEALSRYEPHRVARLNRLASQLVTFLGDDHDLAVLQAWVGGAQNSARHSKRAHSIHELKRRIKRSRAKLQHDAFSLGAHAFLASEQGMSFRSMISRGVASLEPAALAR